MIPESSLWILLMIAGWTILVSLIYEFSARISQHRAVRVIFSFVLSLVLPVLLWFLFQFGKENLALEWFNLSNPAIWQPVFVFLWLLIGLLFSKALNARMHLTLRILLGLILSFFVTHYFMSMLRLVYYS